MTMSISARASSGWEGRSGWASSLGSKIRNRNRQPDRPAAETPKLDDQHDHDPAVPPAGTAPGSLGLGAVVQVVCAPNLAARAAKQGVVNGEAQRAGLDEHRDQEVEQP
jgi:hypothetical protein